MTNFGWDWIYAGWPCFTSTVGAIRRAYGEADVLLRLPLHSPDPDAFAAFDAIEDVPLVARHARRSRDQVRHELGLPSAARVVLLSFGAFDAHLDVDALRAWRDYVFLMTPPLASPRRRVPTNVVQLLDQPSDYVSLLAACDAVVTKPGYGIVSDCLANRVPILFTDRGDFREYDVLADALPRLGHARYVPRPDVLAGQLGPHLDALPCGAPRLGAACNPRRAGCCRPTPRVGSRPVDMADRASPGPGRSARLTDVVSIGVRLALLACAGLVAQVGWMLIWTLSYRLTHGNEFTYNFLVSQPLVWEKLRDFQVFANTLVPGVEILDVGPVHPDILYNAMVVGFVLTGLGYLAAILLIDVGVCRGARRAGRRRRLHGRFPDHAVPPARPVHDRHLLVPDVRPHLGHLRAQSVYLSAQLLPESRAPGAGVDPSHLARPAQRVRAAVDRRSAGSWRAWSHH